MQKHAMKAIGVVLLPALFLAIAYPAHAQLCIQFNTEPYSQSFNSMPVTGTSNSASAIPIGFAFSESGTGNNITFAAGDGSSATANTYSFGTTGSTDRAFGEISSATGGVVSVLGGCIVNNTGSPITEFFVGYTGEQWRKGVDNGPADKLDFQYATDAASLNDTGATWINVNSLDFTSPNNAGLAGSRDGNAAANRTVFAPTRITPSPPIAHAGTFFLRWVPVVLGTANDGLAIDDFTFTAPFPCTLDANADGNIEPLTDGLILLRAMFGLTEGQVTIGTTTNAGGQTLNPAQKRTDWTRIASILNKGCGTSFQYVPVPYP